MSIFFLGAGFSQPAGLPLGNALFSELIKYARSKGLYSRDLEYDIEAYKDYYLAVNGIDINEEDINFEEFMSYVDIDSYLGLRGSDTTSISSKIRNLIAAVLYERQMKMTKEDFGLYEYFVEHLQPNDWIFTFNYDTILEKVLKSKNIPYRLYPWRYKELQDTPLGINYLVDTKDDEVILLKMHGSIDWFDKKNYDLTKDQWARFNLDGNPRHIVFDGRINANEIQRLVSEPYIENDPLAKVYILNNLEYYFTQIKSLITETPLVVSPSYNKLVNLNHTRDFWNGFAKSGLYDTRCAIIGFSLPSHDEYIKQPLYYFIRNFLEFDDPYIGKKMKLKIIDLKITEEEKVEFKSNFSFVNQSKTVFYFKGFNKEAVDLIFSED